MPMQRDEALKLVQKTIDNANLVKHMLACEAVMRRLAVHFDEDAEAWGLAGLLHDLDYAETAQDFGRHGHRTVEMLTPHGLDPEVLDAIVSHPGHKDRETPMAQALYAVDPLTGLVVAATLMHPSKTLAAVVPETVLKRFKEKRFAAGANREQIASCSELGLSLEEFVAMALEAMQSIDAELGLA